MKLLSAGPQRLVFRLSQIERDWLIAVLNRYPVVPESHSTLTRGGNAALREHEPLLREALAEQRNTLRERIRNWLATPGRWRPTESGHRLVVPRDDVEWLLQALNDVRVGCWLRLGAPEELPREPEKLPPERQMDYALMEVGGAFQMTLLDALDEADGP